MITKPEIKQLNPFDLHRPDMQWNQPGEKKLTGGQNWQNKTMSTTQWSPAPMAPQPMPVPHVVRRPTHAQIPSCYKELCNLNILPKGVHRGVCKSWKSWIILVYHKKKSYLLIWHFWHHSCLVLYFRLTKLTSSDFENNFTRCPQQLQTGPSWVDWRETNLQVWKRKQKTKWN